MSIIKRPWGFMEVIDSSTYHKFKRITVYPNQQLSLQFHMEKTELWIINEGVGCVTLCGDRYNAEPGYSFIIVAGANHRIKNTSDTENLVFSELAVGFNVREEDITRIEDEYGRA